MTYYIDLEASGYSPSEAADINQCLETLYSVAAGTQPLDRNFGLDLSEAISAPVNVAKNQLALEIIEKTETYEPRVSVDSVTFEADNDGNLSASIHLVKPEG